MRFLAGLAALGLWAMAANAQDEPDYCGAFYTLDDFVGNWQVSVGSGVIGDAGGTFALAEPNSYDFDAPMMRVGDSLFLDSPEGTFELAEIADTAAANQWGFGASSDQMTPDQVAITAGCPLDLLPSIGGTTRVTTPEGEPVDITITLLVVGQTAELEPSLLYGAFRWSGVEVAVGATRPMVMTLIEE